jgi:hypothetical protein
MPSFEYFCLVLNVFLLCCRTMCHAARPPHSICLAVHQCCCSVKYRIEDHSKYLKHDQIVAVNDAVTNAPNLSATVLRRIFCFHGECARPLLGGNEVCGYCDSDGPVCCKTSGGMAQTALQQVVTRAGTISPARSTGAQCARRPHTDRAHWWG